MKSIEIIVSSNGETRVETKGFSGAECKDVSRFIERAFGTVGSEQLTSEFHIVTDQQQQLREGL